MQVLYSSIGSSDHKAGGDAAQDDRVHSIWGNLRQQFSVEWRVGVRTRIPGGISLPCKLHNQLGAGA